MKKTVHFLIIFILISCSTVKAAVYDCFLFFNELELLKMRLEELDPVVDYFVIVENIETQRGDLKPFYFYENRHLFEQHLPKIIHLMINERHPEMGLWQRENFQRNCILRCLDHCQPSDLIMISDLDEIPRPHLVPMLEKLLPPKSSKLLAKGKGKTFKKHNKKKPGPGTAETLFYVDGARALHMPIYFYQLNRIPPKDILWVGTVITTYEMILKFGIQHFRDHRWKFPRIENGGWHFTWMGGKEKIRMKMRSVVEGDTNEPNITDEQLSEFIATYPIVLIDDTFPRYILEHADYLSSINYIASRE